MSSQKQTKSRKKKTKESSSQRDVLSQGSTEDENYEINMGDKTQDLNMTNTDDIETPVATPKKVVKPSSATPKKTKKIEGTHSYNLKNDEKNTTKTKTTDKIKKPRKMRTFEYMNRKPGAQANSEGSLLGKSYCIPKGSFAVLIRDIITSSGSTDIKLTKECVAVLQEKTEQYMVNFFWIANILPKLRNTHTVQMKDIKLARLIASNDLEMNVHKNKLNPLFEAIGQKPKKSKKAKKDE
eukprot:gene2827-4234_t